MFHQSKKVTHYLNLFHKTKDISNWFAAFSIYVWEELKLFREEGKDDAKVDERELTNQMIRGITRLLKTDNIPLPIRLFHARNEKYNGNDLDIIIQLDKDKNLYFPCQAKRLYVETAKINILDAKYEKLKYEHGKQQKAALIKHANRTNGFPLYMLYNYSEYDFPINYHYPDKELYGCTLISALHLHENPSKNPTVPHLHPPAQPLTSIVKFKNILSLNSLWGKVNTSHNTALLSDHTIFGDGRWEELAPPIFPPKRFISNIPIQKILTNNTYQNTIEYNPKFRIVFTKDSLGLDDRRINFNL